MPKSTENSKLRKILNETAVMRTTLAATIRSCLQNLERVEPARSHSLYREWRNEADQLSEAKAVLTTPTSMTTAMIRLERDLEDLREQMDQLCGASEDPPVRSLIVAGAGADEGAGGDGGVEASAESGSVMGVMPDPINPENSDSAY